MDEATWRKLQEDVANKVNAVDKAPVSQQQFSELFALLGEACLSADPPSADSAITIELTHPKEPISVPAGRYPGITLRFLKRKPPAVSGWEMLAIDGATFLGHFYLEGERLIKLSLSNCDFLSSAKMKFNKDEASGYIALRFEGVHFLGPTDMYLGACEASGRLDGVTFHKALVIEGGTFKATCGELWFGDSVAVRNSVICNEGNTLFRNRRIGGSATFSGVRFETGAHFRMTRFAGLVLFEDCHAAYGAKRFEFDFSRARFSGVVTLVSPNITQACSELSFARAMFRYPPNVGKNFGHISVVGATFSSHSAEDYLPYHHLRLMLEGQNEHDDASAMFAHEQRAHATYVLHHLPSSVAGTLSAFGYWATVKAYVWLNGAGHDFVRPVIGIIALNGVAYMALASIAGPPSDTKPLAPHSTLWLQNIFAPFSFLTRDVTGVSITAKVVAISLLQSIGTIVLLALALLAIRRRFKKIS